MDKNVDNQLRAGEELLLEGKMEQALQCFEEVRRLEPGSQRAAYAVADCLCMMGLYEKSEAACREALAVNPENADLWELLGKVLIWLEKYSQALEAYRNAAKFAEGGVPRRKLRVILERLDELADES